MAQRAKIEQRVGAAERLREALPALKRATEVRQGTRPRTPAYDDALRAEHDAITQVRELIRALDAE